jgi:hypothetical protein
MAIGSFSDAVLRRVSSIALVVVLAGPSAGSVSPGAPSPGRAIGWGVASAPSRLDAERASGSPVRRRPTDGGGDPEHHGYAVSSLFVCGGHVCVHWVRSTSDAPPSFDGNHNLVPDQVERTLDAFEAAWRTEVVGIGFRPPRSDATSIDHGPNADLDVYLVDLGADGLGGYIATDDPRATEDGYLFRDYSAYIVVDNDFSVTQLGSSGGEGGLQVTAAHEFFHAVQYAYDSGEDDWMMEGTAVWIEDQVADDVNANRSWLGESMLTHPWVPVDSSRGLNEYGSWIFWRFLTESEDAHGTDPTLIRRVWELAADGPGDLDLFSARAVAQTLGVRHRSLAGALAGFGIWNQAPAAFYEEGTVYPQAPVERHHRVSPQHPMAGWATMQLNHLTTGAASFEPGAGTSTTASLRLMLDGPAKRTGSAARVLIVMRSGALRVVPVTLDRDGNADVRLPFGSRDVRRVVLVFANANTSFHCWTGAGYSCNGRSRADGIPFSYLAALV